MPSYPSLEAMLADHHLDAVSLCTPPAIRSGLAVKALAAGLDVMVEKPPAAALSQAEMLRQQAIVGGNSLFAAWHSRESAPVDAAQAWLAERRVIEVVVDWREDVRHWHPGQDWLLAAGGFGVFDPAINALSILTKILPGALALESSHLAIPSNRNAPVQAEVILRHDGAAAVHLGLDILHQGPQQWDIRVVTDRGTLTMQAGGHIWAIDGGAQPVEAEREYPRLYSRFAELVAARGSDFDTTPLMLVADAMMLGKIRHVAPFHF